MSTQVTTAVQRGIMRMALVTIGVFFAWNVFLVSDHHRIRVSLINVIETTDSGWLDKAPVADDGVFIYEDPAGLEHHVPLVELPPEDAGPPTVRALQLFSGFVDVVSRSDPRDACWNSESPQLTTERLQARNCRAFCSDYAMLLATAAQKAGIPARRIALESPDGMGGGTHVVAELWLEDLGQWVMFDLTHFVYLRDDTGRYLSLPEARRLLLSGERQKVVPRQLTTIGAQLQPEKILDYYTARFPDAYYVKGSDLFTESRRSFVRRMVSRAEQALSRFGPTAMMPPRFIGRLLLTRTRYRVLDEFNPASYSPRAWFIAYRVMLWAAILAVAVLVWGRIRHGSWWR